MNGVEKTVFIVEDALAVRVALTRMLHVAGYRVRSFKSAEDFLDEQDEAEPGCLLLDVFLPGLSGIELQRELVSFAAAAAHRLLDGQWRHQNRCGCHEGGRRRFSDQADR